MLCSYKLFDTFGYIKCSIKFIFKMVSNIYYVGKINISNKMFARAIVTYDDVTQAFGACVKFVERNHFYFECCSGK